MGVVLQSLSPVMLLHGQHRLRRHHPVHDIRRNCFDFRNDHRTNVHCLFIRRNVELRADLVLGIQRAHPGEVHHNEVDRPECDRPRTEVED